MEQHRITKAVRIQTERTNEMEHSTPLFITSSFCYDSAEEMRATFADETDFNIYSRLVILTLVNLPIKLLLLKVQKQVMQLQAV
jgi:O-acetylhomoserine/O-acetylserine sulfhydrylase-like pyridoxal-dependent enzyme